MSILEDWHCPYCQKTDVEKRKRGPHVSGCSRKANARYVYKDGDTHHPYEWKACEQCLVAQLIRVEKRFCSYACSKTFQRKKKGGQ